MKTVRCFSQLNKFDFEDVRIYVQVNRRTFDIILQGKQEEHVDLSDKMKSFFLFVIIIFIQIQFNFSTINLNTFRKQALIAHNFYRRLHGAQPIELNSTINAISQAYANVLAANDTFSHSGRSGLGENLWAMWSSNAITYVNGSSFILKKNSLID